MHLLLLKRGARGSGTVSGRSSCKGFSGSNVGQDYVVLQGTSVGDAGFVSHL